MFSQIANLTRFRSSDLFSNYGKCLVNTNKHKLYYINSKHIFNESLQKPDCQRLLDNDQVNKIYNYQMEHYKKFNTYFFTNPITIGLLENKYYIIAVILDCHCQILWSYPTKYFPQIIIFLFQIIIPFNH